MDFWELTGTDQVNESKILRRGSCGSEKVTNFIGVQIHQGKRKCGEGPQQHCTVTASQTSGTQSQVTNHNAEGSSIAEGG